MHEFVDLSKFNFSYNGKKLFSDFSLKIKEGTFNMIIGNSGVGMTTLSKVLAGVVFNDYELYIADEKVTEDNIFKIRKNVEYISENSNNLFVCNSVEEEMYFYLKNKGLSNISIKNKIDALMDNSDLKKLLALSPNNLSGGEKQLVAVLLAIMSEPKLLIIDNALSMLSNDIKLEIFGLLKEMNNEKCTILYFTHDSEDILIGTDIIILEKGKIILQEKKENSFEDIKLFTKNNIKLPFIVELSNKLIYYKVIDKIYYDEDKLVNDLWK